MDQLPADEQIRQLSERRMIALIAYIQKLGDYEEVNPDNGRERKMLNPPDQFHSQESSPVTQNK